jgi:hypothetical protein
METRVSSYDRGDLLLCARAELNTSGQRIADEFTIAPAEGRAIFSSEVGNTCDHRIRKLNRQLAQREPRMPRSRNTLTSGFCSPHNREPPGWQV